MLKDEDLCHICKLPKYEPGLSFCSAPHCSAGFIEDFQARNPVGPQFQGISPHRYKDNPVEHLFALEWQKRNQQARSTLAYLMSTDNRGDVALSERDWQVAATVIQWLGSPVGQSFLERVGFRRGPR